MTTLTFGKKTSVYRGKPATHYTHELVQYCSYVQGDFKETAEEAARESLGDTYYDSEEGPFDYYDAGDLFDGPKEVKIFELVKDGNKFYWNGKTLLVVLDLQIKVIGK